MNHSVDQNSSYLRIATTKLAPQHALVSATTELQLLCTTRRIRATISQRLLISKFQHGQLLFNKILSFGYCICLVNIIQYKNKYEITFHCDVQGEFKNGWKLIVIVARWACLAVHNIFVLFYF